jgi:gamma-glutamylcyclotransferase
MSRKYIRWICIAIRLVGIPYIGGILRLTITYRSLCRKWIINDRGYANIIPSKGHIVYGLMYELTAYDEKQLDGFEGVPHSYTKQIIPVDFTTEEGDGVRGTSSQVLDALVYVDVERMLESEPVKEYIHRMNMGIADGIQKGIPKEYFDKYLRLFIPEELSN